MASTERENSNSADVAWEECPAGELTQMVTRLDAAEQRRRSKQIYGTALISTVVFAGVVLAMGTFFDSGTTNYGGIDCAYCRNHLAEYFPHLNGDAVLEDAQFVASMKTHLEKCTFCRAKFRSLYPNFELSHRRATRPVLTVALLPQFAVGGRQNCE